jgi:hypothetical protein
MQEARLGLKGIACQTLADASHHPVREEIGLLCYPQPAA